ncbi:MAG: hypothetical protein ACREBE_04800 [bacterium]
MSKRLRVVRRVSLAVAVVAFAGSALVTTAEAQVAPSSIDSAGRADPCATKLRVHPRYAVSLYGWMTGISGETGVRDLSADVDVPFRDLLDHLRFAAMGAFEVSYGPLVGIVDAVYSSVEVDHTLSLLRRQPELNFTMKMLISQVMAGYTFRAGPNVAVDALAGTRIWSFNSTLTLTGDTASRERSRSPTWADGVGGLRVRWMPTSSLYVGGEFDGGGGGSDGTGQAIGTLAYDVARHWSVFASYRYLQLNYRKNDYFFDGHFGGPVIGGVYRW